MAGGLILSGQHPHILDPVQVEIRDAEGRVLSSLGQHPGDERYIADEGTDQARMYQPIFGATVAQVPWGDLVVHSLNNRYEVRAFAQDGSLARIVRWGNAPRAPTREEVDAYIEERASWYPVNLTPSEIEEYQAEARRAYQSLPVVEHMPAFASVIVDRSNHLWVEEYELPGDERPGSVWTVFDEEGRLLGSVELPEDGLWTYEIGEDYILLVTRNELHVEYVQLWPLERTQAHGSRNAYEDSYRRIGVRTECPGLPAGPAECGRGGKRGPRQRGRPNRRECPSTRGVAAGMDR